MNRGTFSMLLLILIFCFCLRFQNIGEVFDSKIYYFEYDPYYHMRLVELIVVEGYRPNFDQYLNYPHGLQIDWPPLFDYILAIPGFLLGFKASEVFAVILPPILAVLSTLLVYLISLEIMRNEKFALISAFIFSVSQIIVWRSLLGYADHHIWVIFLLLVSILFSFKPRFWKLFAGIPLLLMAFSWLGAPIYAALIAISSLIHFKEKELRLLSVSSLIPALSAFLNPFLGISFLIIALFLFIGSFVKRFEERFRYATLTYLIVCLIATLIAYFLPIGWFGFVRSGINYIFGADIYLPTIDEARSFQILEIVSASGYFFFVLALPSLLIIRHRFLETFLVLSLSLSSPDQVHRSFGYCNSFFSFLHSLPAPR